MPVDEAEIGRLYSEPPDAFTATRDAIAKRLKAEGDKEAAAEVKGLRRPTVAAWALNLLAHRRPDDIVELRAAGDALRAAQRKAMSGVKDSGLREAMANRRQVVDRLTVAALQLLEDEGRPAATQREAVAATLDAAASDATVAEVLAAGRLASELSGPSGFDALDGLTALSSVPAPRSQPDSKASRTGKPPKSKKQKERDEPDEPDDAVDDAPEEPAGPDPAVVREAEDRLAAARAGAAEARAAHTEATRAAAEADAAADAAHEDVERLTEELAAAREAERAAKAARDEAHRAEKEARRVAARAQADEAAAEAALRDVLG